MSKTLSTVDDTLDRVYLYGMNGGLGYEKFENELSPNDAKASLRTLVEEMMEEVIGEDEIYLGKTSPRRYQLDRIYNINRLRSEQRHNVPKLLEQILEGEMSDFSDDARGEWGEAMAEGKFATLTPAEELKKNLETEALYEYLLPKAKELAVPIEYVEWLIYSTAHKLTICTTPKEANPNGTE